jgi:hypothetical protein
MGVKLGLSCTKGRTQRVLRRTFGCKRKKLEKTA